VDAADAAGATGVSGATSVVGAFGAADAAFADAMEGGIFAAALLYPGRLGEVTDIVVPYL